MSKRFAIFGLGQFGRSLARSLAELGCDVLAVDRSQKLVDAIAGHVAQAAVADVRDREALAELCSSKFDVAVISMGAALEASILATLHLCELGIEEIWAEASNEDCAVVLSRVGATRTFSPERDMGERLARRFANPNLIQYLPLSDEHAVLEAAAPSWAVGKTLAILNLRQEMRLAVIAIRSADETVTVVPGGDVELKQDDLLTLVGRDEDLRAFQKRS